MKKKIYSLILLLSVAFVFSCTDDSLDPLQTKKVLKGTELALRGTQLNNLYNLGKPGAEVFPKIMTGNEVFTFDGEYLSQDVTTLASVDVYVIQKGAGGATTRLLMQNVPGSNFTISTYKGPSGTISMTLPAVLAKLGLPAVGNPVYLGNVGNPLLTTYQPGINFELDLNLKDGTQVKASDLIAAGLYQSNQFYPAQKLTWTMTDYCSYVANTWGGQWFGDEVGVGVFSPPGGDNMGNFVAVAADTWQMDNFFGDGPGNYAVVKFTASTSPSTQIVVYPNDAGKTYQQNVEARITGSGTYNQCTQTFSMNTSYLYTGASSPYVWIYNFHR